MSLVLSQNSIKRGHEGKEHFLLKLITAWKLFELGAKRIMIEARVPEISNVIDVYGELPRGKDIEKIAIEVELSNFITNQKYWEQTDNLLKKIGIQRLIVVSPVKPKSEVVEWWNAADLIHEFLFFLEYVDKVMTLWNKLANNKAMRKTIGLPIYLAKVREFVLEEKKR